MVDYRALNLSAGSAGKGSERLHVDHNATPTELHERDAGPEFEGYRLSNDRSSDITMPGTPSRKGRAHVQSKGTRDESRMKSRPHVDAYS